MPPRMKSRKTTGVTVHPVPADVSGADQARALVAAAVTHLGGLDIVVHNAGGPPAGDFFSMTEAQWQKAFEQNLLSFVRIVHAAVPEMKKAGGGRILTIASSSIKQPIPNLVLSNALRTGIWGTAKTLVARAGPAQHPRQRHRAGTDPDRADRRTRSRHGGPVGHVAGRGAASSRRPASRSGGSASRKSSPT